MALEIQCPCGSEKCKRIIEEKINGRKAITFPSLTKFFEEMYRFNHFEEEGRINNVTVVLEYEEGIPKHL